MRFGGGGRHRDSPPSPSPPRPPQPPPPRRGAAAGTARRRPARPGRCPSPAGPPPQPWPLARGLGGAGAGLLPLPAPRPFPLVGDPAPAACLPPSRARLPPPPLSPTPGRVSTSPGTPPLSLRPPGAPRLSPWPGPFLRFPRLHPPPSVYPRLFHPPAPTSVLPLLACTRSEWPSRYPCEGGSPPSRDPPGAAASASWAPSARRPALPGPPSPVPRPPSPVPRPEVQANPAALGRVRTLPHSIAFCCPFPRFLPEGSGWRGCPPRSGRSDGNKMPVGSPHLPGVFRGGRRPSAVLLGLPMLCRCRSHPGPA